MSTITVSQLETAYDQASEADKKAFEAFFSAVLSSKENFELSEAQMEILRERRASFSDSSNGISLEELEKKHLQK